MGGCDDGIIHECGSRSRVAGYRGLGWSGTYRGQTTMGYPRAQAGPYMAGKHSQIGRLPSQIGLQYREGQVQKVDS